MTNTLTSYTPVGANPGDIIAGRYRVERVLGAGGMGVVVAAHHLQLDTKVAIKLLLPSALTNHDVVSRFAREARAAVKITSEHVARVLDVGTLDTGAPYMVMEFLEGGDLAGWIKQKGRLPIDLAVDFVLQASVAVAEAHGLGIVHRDLKPSNLFCVRRSDGQLLVKVLDFGISKVTGADPYEVSVTASTTVMGSPLYMSPEQMHSAKSADVQSDIWALGVILYEMVTGRVPFDGEAATEIAILVATRAPVPPRALRPDLPPGLEAVILKCLEKGRAQRYRSVAALALALAEFAPAHARAHVTRITGTLQAAGHTAIDVDLPRPSVDPPASPAATSAPVAGTGRTPAGPSRVFALLALAGLGILVGGIAATRLVHFGPRPAPPASAPATSSLADSASAAQPPLATLVPAASTDATPLVDAGARPAPKPAAKGRPAGPAAPSHVVDANCDPPYTLDDQGRKHFKPECYLNR